MCEVPCFVEGAAGKELSWTGVNLRKRELQNDIVAIRVITFLLLPVVPFLILGKVVELVIVSVMVKKWLWRIRRQRIEIQTPEDFWPFDPQ